jgi:hypothetical protein
MLCILKHATSVKTGVGTSTSYELLSLHGVLKDRITIDALALGPVPPADEPVTSMTMSTYKVVSLPSAYKAYVQWRAAKTAADKQRATAVAPSSSQPSPSALPTATLLLSLSASQPSTTGPQDEVDLPCVLCKRPAAFLERTSCAFPLCNAPLCKVASGCTGNPLAVGPLLYCSNRCGSADTTTSAALTRPHRPKTFHSSVSSSQPSIASTPVSAITCSSCYAVLTTSGRAVCDGCCRYICRPPKNGQSGCTRAGWSHGGTIRIGGLKQCIECRFQHDERWVKFLADLPAADAQHATTHAEVVDMINSDDDASS